MPCPSVRGFPSTAGERCRATTIRTPNRRSTTPPVCPIPICGESFRHLWALCSLDPKEARAFRSTLAERSRPSRSRSSISGTTISVAPSAPTTVGRDRATSFRPIVLDLHARHRQDTRSPRNVHSSRARSRANSVVSRPLRLMIVGGVRTVGDSRSRSAATMATTSAPCADLRDRPEHDQSRHASPRPAPVPVAIESTPPSVWRSRPCEHVPCNTDRGEQR